MKEIIALQEYTDKYVSLYEGQIRNLTDDIANQLIAKQIVKEHNDQTVGTGSTILIKTNSQGELINDDGTYVTQQQMNQYAKNKNDIEILYKNQYYRKSVASSVYPGVFIKYKINNTSGVLTIQCFTLSLKNEGYPNPIHFVCYQVQENSIKKYILEPYTE